MKVVKIVFWPYHRVEEEETKPLLKTASKSDVGNVLTRRHAPARLLPTRATRHTRLLHPDELTQPEYQTTRPTCQTRIRMTSSWRNHDASMHVSAQSAGTSASSQHDMSSYSQQHVIVQSSQWDPPATSPDASRAKSSRVRRAELEPSREPRDRIQCSWAYLQPDMRLNLGRLSGQNCFDQILAVWNAIWTFSDLFPANLIVPDAMVWSDHWDLRSKMAVVN